MFSILHGPVLIHHKGEVFLHLSLRRRGRAGRYVDHGAVHLFCDGMLHCVLERQFLRLIRADLQVPLHVVELVESDRLRLVVLLRVFDDRFLQCHLWLQKKISRNEESLWLV